MNATFDLGGFVLEISESGHLSSLDGKMGASSKGNIGLQLTTRPLTPDSANPPKTVFQGFVKPSQARAIASALLSAATEARDAGGR